MKQDISLYIHIPFCVSKCRYCDFLSFPSCTEGEQIRYMEALMQEIEAYRELAQGYKVTTLFLGGGTPSILKEGLVEQLFHKLYSVWQISEDAEITLEANPGTLTREKLAEYRTCGINRLSIGLQSSRNDELKKLGRIHNYEQFVANYQLARAMGFRNINVDIMAALPGQNLHSYGQTLARITALKPEHISAYSLIVEEGTPLAEDETLLKELPSEQEERRMYYYTRKALQGEGYERYEISNYAKAGYACRHNQVYWTGGDYLGLGLGASSYFRGQRYHNPNNMQNYCSLAQAGRITEMREDVVSDTENSRMEEYMFLGLRMMRGVSIEDFEKRFGKPMDEVYGPVIQSYEKQGLLRRKNGWLQLTERGIDVSNQIFADFLLDT